MPRLVRRECKPECNAQCIGAVMVTTHGYHLGYRQKRTLRPMERQSHMPNLEAFMRGGGCHALICSRRRESLRGVAYRQTPRGATFCNGMRKNERRPQHRTTAAQRRQGRHQSHAARATAGAPRSGGGAEERRLILDQHPHHRHAGDADTGRHLAGLIRVTAQSGQTSHRPTAPTTRCTDCRMTAARAARCSSRQP